MITQQKSCINSWNCLKKDNPLTKILAAVKQESPSIIEKIFKSGNFTDTPSKKIFANCTIEIAANILFPVNIKFSGFSFNFNTD